jgi:hypothetical protein
MHLNLDRRMTIVDDNPNLNFHVSWGDKNDFDVILKGTSLPVLQLTGVSKNQLVHLREEIDKALCKIKVD